MKSIRLSTPFLLLSFSVFFSPQLRSDNSELLNMSLENLMNMETLIVSASKTDQKVADSSAAVFVISKEDIRRSGSSHIADLLRMAPGIFSGKQGSSEWAVSPRGFAGKFQSNMLVLVDGRSVFSSLQNSISWDEQNIAVEDIERIEIIRGPGGSLWGANAVNGVINIITKTPEQLEGTRLTGSGGKGDKSAFYVAHGGSFGDTGNFSISAQRSEREGYEGLDFGLEERDWDTSRLRLAVSLESEESTFDINIDGYNITSYPYWPQYTVEVPYVLFNDPEETKDGYALQMRWTKNLSERSSLQSRVSIDDVDRRSQNLEWDTKNIDFDIELAKEFTDGHQLGVGFNSRLTESRWYTGGLLLDIDPLPPEEEIFVYSVFLQYTHFFTENLRVIAGAKTEEHSEVGNTIQPTLRALWQFSDDHRIWGALSKSEATPSRLEFSTASTEVGVIPPSAETGPLPIALFFINDGSKTDNQELLATQIGYRFTPSSVFSVDITAFHNEYENLTNTSPDSETIPVIGESGFPLYLETRTFPSNDRSETTYGLEVALSWQVMPRWHLQYSGSHLTIDGEESTSALFSENVISRSAPEYMHSLRSLLSISPAFEFDVWLRHTSEIEFSGYVDSYFTADLRLGWRILDDLELSAIARNLIEDPHVEYEREAFLTDRFLVEESYSVKLDFRF